MLLSLAMRVVNLNRSATGEFGGGKTVGVHAFSPFGKRLPHHLLNHANCPVLIFAAMPVLRVPHMVLTSDLLILKSIKSP
jgi:hypothetical protein